MEKTLSRALPKEVPDYHQREAAHLRALAETATTPALKRRLKRAAAEHDEMSHDVAEAAEKSPVEESTGP